MVFVTVRLFDATGSYACSQGQETLYRNGYKTRDFRRRIDQADYRWEMFIDANTRPVGTSAPSGQVVQRKNSVSPQIKKWTIEISGLNERFATNFLEKFEHPCGIPFKSADGLSYYVTLANDRNLARDGLTIPISVGVYYINKLEHTGLKCVDMKHIGPAEGDNSSPSILWTLTEWR